MSDAQRRALERLVLAGNLSDPAALEALARMIRRDGGQSSTDVQIADALAREAYWNDVCRLAEIVRERGVPSERLRALLNRGSTWERFFGSLRTGFCAECGSQMPCGDEDLEDRVCDRCAGYVDETSWSFLSEPVLATRRFDNLAGLFQIQDQCHTWSAYTNPRDTLSLSSALRWLLEDVLHEFERPTNFPRHGERVLVLAWPDLPDNTPGTVILSSQREISIRTDLLMRGGSEISANNSFRDDLTAWVRLTGGNPLGDFRRVTRPLGRPGL